MSDTLNPRWETLAEEGYVMELGFRSEPLADKTIWGPQKVFRDPPMMGARPHMPQRGMYMMSRVLWRTLLWTEGSSRKRYDSMRMVYEAKPQQVFRFDLDTE